MEMKMSLDDFLTFEGTGRYENEEYGWGEIVSVKLFGVEVARSLMPRWGSEKSYIDTDRYRTHATQVIQALWNSVDSSE